MDTAKNVEDVARNARKKNIRILTFWAGYLREWKSVSRKKKKDEYHG